MAPNIGTSSEHFWASSTYMGSGSEYLAESYEYSGMAENVASLIWAANGSPIAEAR